MCILCLWKMDLIVSRWCRLFLLVVSDKEQKVYQIVWTPSVCLRSFQDGHPVFQDQSDAASWAPRRGVWSRRRGLRHRWAPRLVHEEGSSLGSDLRTWAALLFLPGWGGLRAAEIPTTKAPLQESVQLLQIHQQLPLHPEQLHGEGPRPRKCQDHPGHVRPWTWGPLLQGSKPRLGAGLWNIGQRQLREPRPPLEQQAAEGAERAEQQRHVWRVLRTRYGDWNDYFVQNILLIRLFLFFRELIRRPSVVSSPVDEIRPNQNVTRYQLYLATASAVSIFTWFLFVWEFWQKCWILEVAERKGRNIFFGKLK